MSGRKEVVLALLAALGITGDVILFQLTASSSTSPSVSQLAMTQVMPVIYPAREVAPPPECEVIGVVINGQSRAYSVAALAPPDQHIFNDRLGDRAVSVTYCGLDDYARVFTDDDAEAPLDLHVSGRYEDAMHCYVGHESFSQKAENAPLEDVEFVRIAWSEWVAKHPTTELYIGRQTQLLRTPAPDAPEPSATSGHTSAACETP